MAENYLIELLDDIAIIRFQKNPSLDDIFNAIDIVSEDQSKKLRLWDVSKGVNLTNTEVLKLSEYTKKKFIIPSKIAFVAPEDFTFGLSRMFEIYRDQEQSETMVFRTEKEALDWLKLE